MRVPVAFHLSLCLCASVRATAFTQPEYSHTEPLRHGEWGFKLGRMMIRVSVAFSFISVPLCLRESPRASDYTLPNSPVHTSCPSVHGPFLEGRPCMLQTATIPLPPRR